MAIFNPNLNRRTLTIGRPIQNRHTAANFLPIQLTIRYSVPIQNRPAILAFPAI
jgi:hypothetical protein